MLALLQSLRLNSEFINLIQEVKKIVVGLIKNAVIPPIPLYIFVSNILRKHFGFIMTVVQKIFYGTEENIDNTNFLQM